MWVVGVDGLLAAGTLGACDGLQGWGCVRDCGGIRLWLSENAATDLADPGASVLVSGVSFGS